MASTAAWSSAAAEAARDGRFNGGSGSGTQPRPRAPASPQLLSSQQGQQHKKRQYDESCLPPDRRDSMPSTSSPHAIQNPTPSTQCLQDNYSMTATQTPPPQKQGVDGMGGLTLAAPSAAEHSPASRAPTLKDYAAQWALLKHTRENMLRQQQQQQSTRGMFRPEPPNSEAATAVEARKRSPAQAGSHGYREAPPLSPSTAQQREKRRRLTASRGDSEARQLEQQQQQGDGADGIHGDYLDHLSQLEEQNGRRLEGIGHGQRHGQDRDDNVRRPSAVLAEDDRAEPRRVATPEVDLRQRQESQHFPSPQLARLDALRQQLQHQSSSSPDRAPASPAPEVPSYRQLPAHHDHHSQGHRHDSSSDCCCSCPATRDQLRAMADRVRFLESEVDYHLARQDQARHLAHRVRELEGEVGFLRQQHQPKTS